MVPEGPGFEGEQFVGEDGEGSQEREPSARLLMPGLGVPIEGGTRGSDWRSEGDIGASSYDGEVCSCDGHVIEFSRIQALSERGRMDGAMNGDLASLRGLWSKQEDEEEELKNRRSPVHLVGAAVRPSIEDGHCSSRFNTICLIATSYSYSLLEKQAEQ